ncbi:MAG: coproporphyrinogen III oxidase family protein [Clostridia bacterium]|nr:coproporphyrinogen III oxidase family protein [Clostridia bacterium]
MSLGIYLHVPFCKSKCPYCDFYSVPLPEDDLLDRYVACLIEHMRPYRGEAADTLYFGGGTPSLLGGERIARLIGAAADCFGLTNAEITLEINPGDPALPLLRTFRQAGGNRLSIGLQSGNPALLHTLGRRHSPADFLACAEAAARVGLTNLSADWMLALPGGTAEPDPTVLPLLRQAGVRHVSAYLLKTEPGTPFFARRHTLALPDEEQTAAQYLAAAALLRQNDWQQYEISNFAVPGFESRHNLKYWNAEPYLGFGPAAHSFYNGRRFAFARDLAAFLQGAEPVPAAPDPDIPDGSPAEYLMLRLRLTAGLSEAAFAARFGRPIPAEWRQRAARIPAALLCCDGQGLRLTPEGFLVSNAVLRQLLAL